MHARALRSGDWWATFDLQRCLLMNVTNDARFGK